MTTKDEEAQRALLQMMDDVRAKAEAGELVGCVIIGATGGDSVLVGAAGWMNAGSVIVGIEQLSSLFGFDDDEEYEHAPSSDLRPRMH